MANKPVIVCLSPTAKQLLTQLVEESGGDIDIDSIPNCKGGAAIELGSVKEGQKVKKKRPPSEYQKFVSECMKAANIQGFGQASGAMKECAVKWRERKGD